MGKAKKILLCVFVVFAAIAATFFAYSLIEGRSPQAIVIRQAAKSHTITQTKYEQSKQDSTDKSSVEIPKRIKFARPMKEYRMDGMQVFEMATADESKPIILYLHGGGYIHTFSKMHWKMLAEISEATGCGIIAPNYPLLPKHTAREAHALVLKLYRELLKRYPAHRIIIMGDSAGGGFSLALAEEINDLSHPLPRQVILISPWVDITGGDESIEEYDTWLRCKPLRQYGLDWANNLNPHDPMVSPLYGNMKGLPSTDIFVGTWEIFYPDIIKCSEKLKEAGVSVSLHVGFQMGHVYPLYPAPEGKKARKEIAEIINSVKLF